MNRRSMLRGAGGALAGIGVALPAIIPASPDAELIAVCAEFDACDRRVRYIYDEAAMDEDATAAAAAPLFAREGELLERLYQLRATTAEGMLARARTLAQHGGDGAFSLELDHSTGTGRMVIALMRDALAISDMPIPSKLVGEAQS